jgi:hypothetical protein
MRVRRRKHSIDEEIAHLRDLDLSGLHARWRAAFRKVAPPHLPRHLLFGVLVYRLQVDEFGDLDPATRRALEQSRGIRSRKQIADRLEVLDRQQSSSEPGTVLMREWKGRQHRVVVMADGFAWNGRTYKSLSAVAFAMTGTRWNGPRFFGMRRSDK